MKYTMKKLASSALICAAAVLAAPAAQADFVTFETFSNNVSATLGGTDTTYNGGQSFNTSGLTLTMSDSAFAQSLGMNGLAGAIIDGTNPFNCALLSCPSGNLTKYFGGLNHDEIAEVLKISSVTVRRDWVFAKAWLRNELKSLCESRIKSLAQRSIVQGKVLLDLWQRYLAGDKNVRWLDIWLCVVLEDWMEKNSITE